MRSLTFGLLRKAKETNAPVRSVTQSWEDWVVLFSQRDVRPVRGLPEDLFWRYLRKEIPNEHLDFGRSKTAFDASKDGAAVSLAEYVVPRRANKNVRSVQALALDVDDCDEEQVLVALERLAPYDYFAWTTFKHTTAHPKLRVIVPLAEPVAVGDYAVVWAAWSAFTGGVTDKSTSDAARLLYLPSCPPETGGEAWCVRHDGERWLSAAELSMEPLVLVDASVSGDDDTRDRLDEDVVRSKLRRMPKDNVLKSAAAAVLMGAPFAEPSHRHDVLRDITWYLVLQGVDVSPRVVTRVFASSFAHMPDKDLTEVEKAYSDAVVKIKSTIEKTHRGGAAPFTSVEIAALAARVGVAPEELKTRWIVQSQRTYWFLREDGSYSPPVSVDEAEVAMRDELARAPVNLVELSKSGARPRTIKEVAREHGKVARRVMYDLSACGNFFDGETLREGKPLRPIVPRHDPDIERWLAALGGESHEKLLDWLAVFPNLRELTLGLYLAGVPSTGKTILANGLARLWTEGSPASIATVLTTHGAEDLTRCPLVLADESIPRRINGNPVSAEIRSMVATTTRSLNRKYRNIVEMQGAIRLILTANHENLLQDDIDSQSVEDRAAIAGRFFLVKVGPEAVDVLNQIKRERLDEEWVRGDRIAAHTLWLAQNRKVEWQADSRFRVTGDESDMARRLAMTGSRWNTQVNEWLVLYLMNPVEFERKQQFELKQQRLILRGVDDGAQRLLVNAQALSGYWDLYLNTKKDPDTYQIGRALKAISMKGTGLISRGMRSAQVRYHMIDMDNLLQYARELGIGDEEQMLAAVEPGAQPAPEPTTGNESRVVPIKGSGVFKKIQKAR